MMPPGRLCEEGRISGALPLRETPEDRSPDGPDIPRSQRTEWNVRDSDATLILWPSALAPIGLGTRWTVDCAVRYQKPSLIVDPADTGQVAKIQSWLSLHSIGTLNIAGPSETICPGIGTLTERFLVALIRSNRSGSAASGSD